MIRFENVTKEFPNKTAALREVSFHVEPGEFVFIVGPSGAGKTTILRLLIREILPSSGEIYIEENDLLSMKKKQLPELRRQIGAVFQDYKLLEDWTVEENVSLICEMISSSPEEVKKEVEEILKLVSLEDKRELFPSQISGGELQRTAIARALATKPKIVFADEPTGNLDLGTSWEIMKLLTEINKGGTTVLVATHNQEILKSLDKRVIELMEGRVVKDTKKPTKKKKKATTKQESDDKKKKPIVKKETVEDKKEEKTKDSEKPEETKNK